MEPSEWEGRVAGGQSPGEDWPPCLGERFAAPLLFLTTTSQASLVLGQLMLLRN